MTDGFPARGEFEGDSPGDSSSSITRGLSPEPGTDGAVALRRGRAIGDDVTREHFTCLWLQR